MRPLLFGGLIAIALRGKVTDPSPPLYNLQDNSKDQPLQEILAISGALQGFLKHPMKPCLKGELPDLALEPVLPLPGKKSRNDPSHHGRGKRTACLLFKSGVNAERGSS